jgi:hypothetical protein
MGVRDLVPWTKDQQLSTGREAFDPFFTLHREMNRLFDVRTSGPAGRRRGRQGQSGLQNGVLTVTIPKSERPNPNVKRIAINTN